MRIPMNDVNEMNDDVHQMFVLHLHPLRQISLQNKACKNDEKLRENNINVKIIQLISNLRWGHRGYDSHKKC